MTELTETKDTKTLEAEFSHKIALEKLKNKYQMIIGLGSAFFTTGLGVLLVFMLNMTKENNAQTVLERDFTAKYAPVIVSDALDRLRVAEFWARISDDADERTRWGHYEEHLKELLMEVEVAEKAKEAAETPEEIAAAQRKEDQLKARTESRVDYNPMPQVFTHVSEEGQRDVGAIIRKSLRNSSLANMPGIENVGSERSPENSEFRYFRKKEESVAREIFEQIALEVPSLNFRYVPGYEKSARPVHFEVWLEK